MTSGYRWNSTIRAGGKPPNRRNEKRIEREFRRAYHSEERVIFVRSLPCLVSGKRNCENVHIEGDGMGRKSHFTLIVPLRQTFHRELHDIGRDAFEAKYGVNLDEAAAKTQRGWLEYSGTVEAGEGEP